MQLYRKLSLTIALKRASMGDSVVDRCRCNTEGDDTRFHIASENNYKVQIIASIITCRRPDNQDPPGPTHCHQKEEASRLPPPPRPSHS